MKSAWPSLGQSVVWMGNSMQNHTTKIKLQMHVYVRLFSAQNDQMSRRDVNLIQVLSYTFWISKTNSTLYTVHSTEPDCPVSCFESVTYLIVCGSCFLTENTAIINHLLQLVSVIQLAGVTYFFSFTTDQCFDAFVPKIFGGQQVNDNCDETNRYYGGLNLPISNAVFVNGLLDPWRKASVTDKLPNASGDFEIISIPGG